MVPHPKLFPGQMIKGRSIQKIRNQVAKQIKNLRDGTEGRGHAVLCPAFTALQYLQNSGWNLVQAQDINFFLSKGQKDNWTRVILGGPARRTLKGQDQLEAYARGPLVSSGLHPTSGLWLSSNSNHMLSSRTMLNTVGTREAFGLGWVSQVCSGEPQGF